MLFVVVVQSLSHVHLFVTPWTAACQASLSFTTSWSLFRFMSIELVMLSNHLILCRPLLLWSIFPNIKVFSNESALCIREPSIGTSASVFPMNIQGWFPLGLTGSISLLSKGLSRVFSRTTSRQADPYRQASSLKSHILHSTAKKHSGFKCVCVTEQVGLLPAAHKSPNTILGNFVFCWKKKALLQGSQAGSETSPS